MSGTKRLIYLFLLIVVFINLSLVPLWAGDGSGGGKGQPLAVVTSIPANGATGVNNLDAITVTFSKNVVYMTVRENNQKCFSLWRGQDSIPVEVIMADDQIEFDKRRDIIIKPRQPLQSGAAYQLEIAPQLESKSGVTLGEKTTISFTTAGVAANGGIESNQQSPDAVTLPQTEPSASDLTAALPASGPEKDDVSQANNPAQTMETDNNGPAPDQLAEKANKSDGKSQKGPFITIAIAVALIIMGMAYHRKNKK